ncbi:uncharacterized protein EDB91DRAFT_135287 [Suillus paluster]|uniref:uncharacterized protein n=1 Tax=Suillus paluster TaxID=48578 RepID=UPI001B86B9BD|nr:uncharacterized protein EDB91DRAFT_135287 [Suillus paluster]KAG1745970.1 hypothetical protein EDB91DRAFT_135287 [Suillus paluster]
MTVETVGLILPSDVLIIIMENLGIQDLINFSCTCKFVNLLVHEFGWSIYLKHHVRPSFTLRLARKRWSPFEQVRYNVTSDRCWTRAKFNARPLSHPWRSKLQPQIAISTSMMLVAAGHTIYVYPITDSSSLTHDGAPGVLYEGSYSFTDRGEITSITFIPDGHLERTVAVGFADGHIQPVFLPPFQQEQYNNKPFSLTIEPSPSLGLRITDLVESLSCSDNMLLSLSAFGIAGICNLSSDSPLVSAFMNLDCRSWSSFICMKSSTPFTAFGTTSPNPLVVHAVTPSSLSPTPFAVLHPTRERSTAVYDITDAPPSAPWGSSKQVIVSGWYDGVVQVHDMRSNRRDSGVSGSPAPLRPMLTLRDPWSDEPIYSVSCGGGSSSFVAAGTARHSVVAFWDVRRPTQGWSVHAPGNDSSPVYSLILESSRLFGVTQSRPFVFDFGLGVTNETYPSLPPSTRSQYDSLKLKNNGVGYCVTQYNHSRT